MLRTIGSATLALSLSATLLLAGDRTFPSWTIETGEAPRRSAQADLNGDGLADLVLLCQSDGAVEVYSSNGSLELDGPLVLDVDSVPRDVAIADVNNDAKLDVVVACFPTKLVVFLGDGLGQFSAPMASPTVVSSFGLALGDVNQDGNLDAVLTDSSTDLVRMQLGNGDGTFGATTNLGAGFCPYRVSAADLNNDGLVDLVVGDQHEDALYIYLGQGAGLFAAPLIYAVGMAPESVDLVDLDQDTHLDVVTPCSDSDTVALRFGRGDGTFDPLIELNSNSRPRDTSVADLDGDGELDLVVANSGDSALNLFFGLGARSFSSPTRIPAGYSSYTVDAADFEGSGTPDLAVSGLGFDQLLLLQGRGAGANWSNLVLTGESPRGVAVEDLNGDGHLDAVVANENSNDISVLHGSGDGQLQHAFLLPSGAIEGRAVDLSIGDFNGDLLPDIAVNHRSHTFFGNYHVGIHLQLPGGGFAPAILEAKVDNPWDVKTADLNLDGKADLLTPNRDTNDISVLLGNGDGSFTALPRIPLTGLPPTITIADLDGDGVPDFIAPQATGPNNLNVFMGQGDGSFIQTAALSVQLGSADSCAVGDLNMDGIPDLVGQAQATFRLRYWFGNGDGTFGPSQFLDLLDHGSGDTHIADLNGDGINDILVSQNAMLQVVLGLGAGNFDAPQAYASGARSYYSALGDMNEDGWPDLVNTLSSSNGVTVHLNQFDGQPAPGENFCGFSVNSSGGAARISAEGTTSVAAQDLLLRARHLPAGQFGIFFFGAGQTQVPLADGYLCASGGGSGITRLPISLSNVEGVLDLQLDFASPTVSAFLTPGSTWNFQAWFRDGAAGGAGSNLSDGLTIEFQP